MGNMPEKYRMALDQLFSSYEVIVPGAFVYLRNLTYDCSRWSKSAADYFGLPGEYLENAEEIWKARIHPEDRAVYQNGVEAIFAGKSHRIQYRVKNKAGRYVTCACLGSVITDPRTGKPGYFCGTIAKHEGCFDPLTGLRNQYGFMQDLQDLLDRKVRSSVMIFGFHRFSSINDLHGYNFGDLILQKTAHESSQWLGPYGIMYRLDGAKFAIISQDLSPETLHEVYGKMQAKCQRGFEIEGQHLSLTCNGSFTELTNFSINPRTLFAGLHRAYYISKRERDGDLVSFGSLESEESQYRLQVISDISDSIANDCRGFSLCYQPIMCALSGSLKGAEALLRWTSTERGCVPPSQFIPLIETDPLFPILGRWILKQAMTDGLSFLDRYPDFMLNVNLAYTQIKRDDFVDSVVSLLQETGFPGGNLCLEITERCRALDIIRLQNVIRALRTFGVHFAIDDFGTGFSSLSLLRDIQVETIKIDRSFIQNLANNEQDRKLMMHFNGIASLYSSDVCAEGVETTELVEILRENGINSLQGYYFSKPIPYDTFLEKYIT